MLKPYLQLPRPVHILCLGTFINRAGTFFIPFLALYIDKKLGLGAQFATRTMGVFGLGSIFAALIGGHLADWIGRRTVMLVSLIGGAAILTFFAQLRESWAIMAAAGGFALVADMYRPAASAMIADLVEPERRPQAFGLMYVAINLGFAVGPVIGGLVAKRSFQWLFWGDAGTSAVYALIILAAIRETLPSRKQPAAGAEGVAPDHMPGLAAIRHILSDRTFLVFCVATWLVATVYMQSMSTLPLYLESLGFGTDAYGVIISANGILIVCGQLPLSHFLARFDRGRVVAAAAVVTGVGIGLTALATTTAQFIGTVIIWTLGEMMQASFTAAIVSDLAPRDLRARYMGTLIMTYAGAMMIGVPIGGEVLARLGGKYVWLFALMISLVAAALYWSLHPRIAKVEPAEQVVELAAETPTPQSAV